MNKGYIFNTVDMAEYSEEETEYFEPKIGIMGKTNYQSIEKSKGSDTFQISHFSPLEIDKFAHVIEDCLSKNKEYEFVGCRNTIQISSFHEKNNNFETELDGDQLSLISQGDQSNKEQQQLLLDLKQELKKQQLQINKLQECCQHCCQQQQMQQTTIQNQEKRELTCSGSRCKSSKCSRSNCTNNDERITRSAKSHSQLENELKDTCSLKSSASSPKKLSIRESEMSEQRTGRKIDSTTSNRDQASDLSRSNICKGSHKDSIKNDEYENEMGSVNLSESCDIKVSGKKESTQEQDKYRNSLSKKPPSYKRISESKTQEACDQGEHENDMINSEMSNEQMASRLHNQEMSDEKMVNRSNGSKTKNDLCEEVDSKSKTNSKLYIPYSCYTSTIFSCPKTFTTYPPCRYTRSCYTPPSSPCLPCCYSPPLNHSAPCSFPKPCQTFRYDCSSPCRDIRSSFCKSPVDSYSSRRTPKSYSCGRKSFDVCQDNVHSRSKLGCRSPLDFCCSSNYNYNHNSCTKEDELIEKYCPPRKQINKEGIKFTLAGEEADSKMQGESAACTRKKSKCCDTRDCMTCLKTSIIFGCKIPTMCCSSQFDACKPCTPTYSPPINARRHDSFAFKKPYKPIEHKTSQLESCKPCRSTFGSPTNSRRNESFALTQPYKTVEQNILGSYPKSKSRSESPCYTCKPSYDNKMYSLKPLEGGMQNTFNKESLNTYEPYAITKAKSCCEPSLLLCKTRCRSPCGSPQPNGDVCIRLNNQPQSEVCPMCCQTKPKPFCPPNPCLCDLCRPKQTKPCCPIEPPCCQPPPECTICCKQSPCCMPPSSLCKNCKPCKLKSLKSSCDPCCITPFGACMVCDDPKMGYQVVIPCNSPSPKCFKSKPQRASCKPSKKTKHKHPKSCDTQPPCLCDLCRPSKPKPCCPTESPCCLPEPICSPPKSPCCPPKSPSCPPKQKPCCIPPSSLCKNCKPCKIKQLKCSCDSCCESPYDTCPVCVIPKAGKNRPHRETTSESCERPPFDTYKTTKKPNSKRCWEPPNDFSYNCENNGLSQSQKPPLPKNWSPSLKNKYSKIACELICSSMTKTCCYEIPKIPEPETEENNSSSSRISTPPLSEPKTPTKSSSSPPPLTIYEESIKPEPPKPKPKPPPKKKPEKTPPPPPEPVVVGCCHCPPTGCGCSAEGYFTKLYGFTASLPSSPKPSKMNMTPISSPIVSKTVLFNASPIVSKTGLLTGFSRTGFG